MGQPAQTCGAAPDVPLFWECPFPDRWFYGNALTTVIAMYCRPLGYGGGWLDALIQRLTEVNMVLPGLASAVLANALLGLTSGYY